MAIITAQAVLPPTPQFDSKQTHSSEPALVPEVKSDAPEVTSPKFAALARKEKALREMQRNLQLEKETLKRDRESEQKELSLLRDKQGRFKSDPYGALLSEGLTSDQVAALMMNQPNPADQEITLLKQELAALKAAGEQTNNKFAEVEAKQYADAVKAVGNDVRLFIDGNPDYEILKSEEIYSEIVKQIEEDFKSTNELPQNFIEKIVNEFKAAAEEEEDKYLENERIKKKLSLRQALLQEQQKPQTNQKPQTQTLSNSMVPSSGKPLTARERRDRAIAAFQGKLS